MPAALMLDNGDRQPTRANESLLDIPNIDIPDLNPTADPDGRRSTNHMLSNGYGAEMIRVHLHAHRRIPCGVLDTQMGGHTSQRFGQCDGRPTVQYAERLHGA